MMMMSKRLGSFPRCLFRQTVSRFDELALRCEGTNWDRLGEVTALAGLDFGENQHAAAFGDDVDLRTIVPVAPVEDRMAFRPKVFAGDLLLPPPVLFPAASWLRSCLEGEFHFSVTLSVTSRPR